MSVLGVEVTPRTVDELAHSLLTPPGHNRSRMIGAHNLHSVYLFHTVPEFALFYEGCDLVLIDGAPILWALNLFGAERSWTSRQRLGSTDWVPDLCAIFARVLVVGGDEKSNRQATARLAEGARNTTVLGLSGADWSASHEKELVDQIESFQPDLVLIGLGMPLQERVALQVQAMGGSRWIATVGGAIDQLAGTQVLAPRWIGRMGVEWLWRLVTNPKRLAHRYLIEPIKLSLILTKRAIWSS